MTTCTNQSLGSKSNEVFWGDGKDFEIQSTILVFGEMAIWRDGYIYQENLSSSIVSLTVNGGR